LGFYNYRSKVTNINTQQSVKRNVNTPNIFIDENIKTFFVGGSVGGPRSEEGWVGGPGSMDWICHQNMRH
jgi:hypothetical protein